MRTAIIFSMTMFLMTGDALAQDKASAKFLTEAIQGNFAEVAMGELAQKNGQSQDVKSYGQMLVSDHGEANKKAMEAAKAMTMNPPAGPMVSKRPIMTKCLR